MKYFFLAFTFLFSNHALADRKLLTIHRECVPPDGGTCLTKEEKEKASKALKELKNIKESPAEIQFNDPVIIIIDWEDRVFINGGEKNPIKLKLKLGTIDRDLEATLPIQVAFREKPPDPIFRLRVRASIGLLVPQAIQNIGIAAKDTGEPFQPFWSGGVDLDFFHLDWFNVAAHVGVRNFAIGPGVDLTKNFGIMSGYGLIYPFFTDDSEWQHTLYTSTYFSFN